MRKLDMAWINGNIYTADDKFSTVAAFGVSGDRFSVVGSTEEVLENCDEHTKIIDLQGKTVLPGLIDAHLHITNTGAMKLNLNLVSKQKQEDPGHGCRCLQQCKKRRVDHWTGMDQ